MHEVKMQPPPPGPLTTRGDGEPAEWRTGPSTGRRCLAFKPGFGRCEKRKHRDASHVAAGMEFDLELPKVCPVCCESLVKKMQANAGDVCQGCADPAAVKQRAYPADLVVGS